MKYLNTCWSIGLLMVCVYTSAQKVTQSPLVFEIGSTNKFQSLVTIEEGDSSQIVFRNQAGKTVTGFLYAYDENENVFVPLNVLRNGKNVPEYRWSYTPFQQFRLYPISIHSAAFDSIRITTATETTVKWIADAFSIPQHQRTLQNEIEGNYVELVICGMMFMMWLYITLKYTQLQTREYLFYSLTIFFSLLHFIAVLLAKVSVDWYSNPIEREFYHRFFQTLSHVAYFQFFRHFTQTYNDQLKFDRVLQVASGVALGYVLIDAWLVFGVVTHYPMETVWIYVRLCFVIFVMASLTFWVSQSRSPLRDYLIAGNLFLISGGLLTMLFNPYREWIDNWLPPFAYPLFYYRAGVLLEVICFSLGLGYKQKLDEKKRDEAERKLHREQLELAKARELDATKSTFFANISHEFRTPLTLIQAPADQILSRSGGQFEREVQLIKSNSQALLRLINQVLELARLESGKWHLQVEQVQLKTFFERVAEPFAYLAVQQNQYWQLTIDRSVTTGYLDCDALEKIINNLAGNAFKHAGPEAMISLHIACDDSNLLMVFKDTGRGISTAQLPHIFDRYYRAEDSQAEGFGIGLAHTRELVKYHHGSIEVSSNAGEGVIFTLQLPVNRAAYVADELKLVEEQPSLPPSIINQIPDRAIVMLVEDHPDLRSFLTTLLQTDYQVWTFSNALQAWEAAQRDVPDLVLCDWMMPGMSGIELCQRLKNTETTNHIPVVMLTARTSESARMEGWQTGADDYIVKPFDSTELLQRLRNLIKQRELLRTKFSSIASRTLPSRTESGPQEKFLLKVRESIEIHLEQSSFGTDQLAREVGFSKVQLHRKLTALVGQSTAEYIRNYRLDRAFQMLKNETGNVSEVAWKTGFESQSHFARVYRERFGYPPSQTLKNLRKIT